MTNTPATHCPMCGKALPKLPPTHALKFCSMTCMGLARRKYPQPRVCVVCGKTWAAMTKDQGKNKTCSRECNSRRISLRLKGVKRAPVRTATCEMCGVEFVIPAPRGNRHQRFCSYQCNGKERAAALIPHASKGRAAWTSESEASYMAKMSGENNPAWKGGVTFMRKKGNYKPIKYVRCPVECLPMARKDGYIMEHRLIMAQTMGRLLTRTEVVHHIDHDPHNNDPANLQLFPDNATHKRAEGAARRSSRTDSAQP